MTGKTVLILGGGMGGCAAAINAEKGGNPAEIAKTENMLAGTLKSLFAVEDIVCGHIR